MAGPDYMGYQQTGFAETLSLLCVPEDAPADLAASIIIVNYNGWRDLERCLRSLAAEPMPGCEVIVVDNASTDDSPQRIAAAFPFVRLVRSGLNLGFGGGSNLGAQLARGNTLVFLNPDTTVAPGWLEPLLAALAADATTGMATSRILMMGNPERVNTLGNDVHLSGLALCRGMGRLREPEPPTTPLGARAAWTGIPATGRKQAIPVASVSGAAFAIHRDLFHAAGGFDETFFLYMEDTDLSMRMQIAGYRCVYVPASVVYHDYAFRVGPMKTYYQERNRYMMLVKTLHWRTLLVLLPALLLAEAITWGFILLRDRQRAHNKLYAYAWIVYWWREIMEKRKQTQRLRRVPDRALLRQTTAALDFAQAGAGCAARLAHVVFDPLFYALRLVSLALVWW